MPPPPAATRTAASAAPVSRRIVPRTRWRRGPAAAGSWFSRHAWRWKYTRAIQYSYSTVGTPNHSTGPLLYMALQTKQDHRLPAQLAARLAQRIETHALRPGTRLPSIRHCAVESRVSRSTVVEAYDQLIAAGLIESRRGSGFYVRLRHANTAARRRSAQSAHPSPGTVL